MKTKQTTKTMKNKIKLAVMTALAITALICSTSCTDARRAKIVGYGADHNIEMYSGGVKVREWTSSGKVLSETNCDGYYFNDKKTGKLIEVYGDIVITRLK